MAGKFAYEPGGREFESFRARQIPSVRSQDEGHRLALVSLPLVLLGPGASASSVVTRLLNPELVHRAKRVGVVGFEARPIA